MIYKKNPCIDCKLGENTNCRDKRCKPYVEYFLYRWRLIHGYYLKYVKPLEGKEENV